MSLSKLISRDRCNYLERGLPDGSTRRVMVVVISLIGGPICDAVFSLKIIVILEVLSLLWKSFIGAVFVTAAAIWRGEPAASTSFWTRSTWLMSNFWILRSLGVLLWLWITAASRYYAELSWGCVNRDWGSRLMSRLFNCFNSLFRQSGEKWSLLKPIFLLYYTEVEPLFFLLGFRDSRCLGESFFVADALQDRFI